MTLEPTRIALARARAGLSKAELARELGATPRTITNYENDGAPDRAAGSLAIALRCPPEFFTMSPAEPLEEERVFFRARRRSTATEKHAAAAAGRTGVELYRLICARFALPVTSVPDYPGLDSRLAAQQLRLDWGLGSDPVPNLVRLAESQGVRVLSLPGDADRVDAFSVWEDGQPYIFLSTLKTAERSRFDLAHEIGHLVLHNGEPSESEDRLNVEREADEFASEFLMPRVLLRSWTDRGPRSEEIISLKRRLGVSAMALAYALHKAARLTDWSYRQVCIDLTRRGYRTGEPQGMKRETSKVFDIVFAAWRKSQGWGTQEIARHLAIHPEDLHALTFGQTLTSVPNAKPVYFDDRVASAEGSPHGRHLSVVR